MVDHTHSDYTQRIHSWSSHLISVTHSHLSLKLPPPPPFYLYYLWMLLPVRSNCIYFNLWYIRSIYAKQVQAICNATHVRLVINWHVFFFFRIFFISKPTNRDCVVSTRRWYLWHWKFDAKKQVILNYV